MRKNTKLSISRQIARSPDLVRATAKVHHLASATFEHDSSTYTPESSVEYSEHKLIMAGNPRYSLIDPLEFNLLYRAGLIDARNKSSRGTVAGQALDNSRAFESDHKQLYAKYDGLDFDHLQVNFTSIAIGTKPGYLPGESQILLLPDPEAAETSFLLEEALLCSAALAKIAPKFGGHEVPLVPSIPLVKLAADVTHDERGMFIKGLSGILPRVFELGGYETVYQDRG